MEKLSFTMENYLEAVYELRGKGGSSRVTDIAARMDVTKASANNAMSVLASKGLITNERYKEISLTPKGIELAEKISMKHRLLRILLVKVLGVDFNISDADACAIEHVISNESILAVRDFLVKEGHWPE